MTLPVDWTPAGFRSKITIEVAPGEYRRMSEVLDPFQVSMFEDLDPTWTWLAGHGGMCGPTQVWEERPRGHSKSSDAAAMILWALTFARRQINGVAAAADKDQAGIIRKGIDTIVSRHKPLQKLIGVSRDRVWNKNSGSELQIISADATTSYGLLCDFFVLDEVTLWRNSDLWDSLLSASAKRPSLFMVLTNAGWTDSWQWPIREAARLSPDWRFRSLDGPQASWITQKILEQKRVGLTQMAYDRVILNKWIQGAGDAFSDAEINRSLAGGLAPMTGTEKGWHFYAGLDLGLSRDASAMAVVGQHVGHSEYIQPEKPTRAPSVFDIMADLGLSEDAPPIEPEWELASVEPATGRLRLADVQAWRATKLVKVDLEQVEAAVLAAHRRFNFQAVNYDPWQCELLAARLVRQGVRMVPTPFVASSLAGMASVTLSAVNDSRIDLYDCPELIADLRRLRVVERPNGCRLESPRDASGHGDRATAFSLALLGTRRHTNTSTTIEGPLLIG